MAKQSKSNFHVRQVKSKDDRRRPSVFTRLKEGESFRMVALFEPDPEAKENPGYLEYYDHWDQQGSQYVPCAGDKCPFCAANDNPSTRAMTVWYDPKADAKDQIKVFTMNYRTTQDISDEAEEEDGILGKTIRIKRLDDRGAYKVKITNDKALSKSELKKAQKALEAKFPDGLMALVERQLRQQMERLKALEALEDDDLDDEDEDDEEEETPKSKSKGNSKSKSKAKDEDEDEEEEDEEDDEDEEEDDEDEEDEDDADEDEDGDDDEDEDEDEEEDEEEEAAEEKIEGGSYEIVKANEKDEIIDLKNKDGKVKMWVGDGVDVDYDDAKTGAKVKVDAQTDDEGDWIITSLKVTRKAQGKGKGKK